MATEAGGARLTRHGAFVHLTIQSIEVDDDAFVRREVDLLAGPNLVVTVHDGPVAALSDFEGLIAGDTLLGELDSGSFVAALVDSVLSTYFARVEEVEREIDRLDDLALRGRDSDRFLTEVLRLRRRIAVLRRTLAPHREAFAPLARSDFEVDERLARPWPRLVDRLERTIDAVENARELLVGSFDVYLGSSAQRTNDVMKALTVLSAVLLPSVVLAGVMGMNFKVPFFDEPGNFWFVLAVMVIFAASLLIFARFRRWI
jgi:magnesium transporter